MKIRHSFIVVVAAVCVVWPFGRAAAQPTPAADPTFASLDPRLLVNRTVTVKATDARDAKTLLRVTGKLLDLSDSTLRLQADGDIREFPARDVLGGLGALTGAGTGSKMQTERVLYLAPDLAPSRTVKIQPIVRSGSTGLAATFRF